MSRLTLDTINRSDRAAFTSLMSFVFEGAPQFVADAWEQRPFPNQDALHRALVDAMYAASPDDQFALIRAHPDLVGRAARAGTLTPESTREQSAAGLDQLTADEIATFERFNSAYRERFQFPFVICARENKKASILAGFATRLDHTPDEEVRIALAEIAKIAHLRLVDVVDDTIL
jgi:2-oxo-4-hydroxy-4-carboxy-5-ureidoimidazoline decarboxylase